MGEITEALRRSRLERETCSPAPVRGEEPRSRPPLRVVPDPPPVEAPALEPSPAPPALGRDRYVPLRWPIARAKAGFWQARAVSVDRRGRSAEAYRHFAVRVARELEARKSGGVLITSALAGEGRTVTACNLALALASLSAGRRIALVDLDLRRPSVAKGLGIPPRVGLEQVLAGEASLAGVQMPTDQVGLDVFPVKRPVLNAHELLVGPRLPQIIGELTRAYRIVVFDAPPVLPVPDVPLVLAHLGACVPVVRSGMTRRASFHQLLELLPREKLIGHFLNQSPAPRYARRQPRY